MTQHLYFDVALDGTVATACEGIGDWKLYCADGHELIDTGGVADFSDPQQAFDCLYHELRNAPEDEGGATP